MIKSLWIEMNRWPLLFYISILFLSCFSQRKDVSSISIKGSDTEVNLVLALAENYMENDARVSISVTGGGSGAGVAALINNKTDIANSSRRLKIEELEIAKKRGVAPIATVFALDALAIIVNESAEIDRISLDLLSEVYRGEITNWNEVGGRDGEISLYGRQSNSGTFIYFRDEVVKAEYSPKVKQMNGTAQIVEAIKLDPNGVGYVGLGYVVDKKGILSEGLRVLAIYSTDADKAISPLIRENITTGTYPIIRPLYQYTNGIATGKLLDYLLYEWSEGGQAIVKSNGYYPITQYWQEYNRRQIQQAYAIPGVY